MIDQDDLLRHVDAVWRAQGGSSPVRELAPCPASGNNRLFVATAGAQRFVVKCYFTGQPEEQDRLDAEWRFLVYADQAGILTVPRPIGCDPRHRIGLYEFIAGRRLETAEITADHVRAAGQFIAALNGPDERPSTDLPPARESGFSLAEHMATLERRLERLSLIGQGTHADRAASELAGRMRAFWQEIRPRVIDAYLESGVNVDEPCPAKDRMLSPSDFGFHNALIQDDGRLVFIDFEYAGWDDVGKLVSDFFFQPAVPVDPAYFEVFTTPILSQVDDPERTRRRIAAVRPIFGLKWCCIMLNCFLPAMAARILYADPSRDPEQFKITQLKKASSAFQVLKE